MQWHWGWLSLFRRLVDTTDVMMTRADAPFCHLSRSSNTEMENLRILCSQLTQQLNMANHSGQTIKLEGGDGAYTQHTPNRGSASTGSFATHQTHTSTGWSVGGNSMQQSPGMSALRQSPGMSPGVWAATAEAPPLIPGGIDQRGGGHDDGMHSLSWMAPEYELDDLL